MSLRQILEEYFHALRIRHEDWFSLCYIHHGGKVEAQDWEWLYEDESTPKRKSQRELHEERKRRLAGGQ